MTSIVKAISVCYNEPVEHPEAGYERIRTVITKEPISDKILYIENESNDPAYNLAFEEYVFTAVSDEIAASSLGPLPVLLLWQNGPSVIIGKYQNTIEEINYDFVQRQRVRVVRRNTGGGAVYHDLGNLNYSFIIPGAQTKVDFGTFTSPVVKALNAQGIPAEQTGRNDILVDGKKFSGNAQQFSKGRLLHHGTIMFDVNMENVAAALKVKPGKLKSKATKSVRSRVTNLKPYFEDGSMDAKAFKKLLLEWFQKEYDVIEYKLSGTQLADIEKLADSKYRTDGWNYGRSPKGDVVRGEFFRCGYVEFHFQIEKHKVKDLQIVGDFFASKDIDEFTAQFKGVDYTPQAIKELLQKADLQSYLGDVTADELLEVIV